MRKEVGFLALARLSTRRNVKAMRKGFVEWTAIIRVAIMKSVTMNRRKPSLRELILSILQVSNPYEQSTDMFRIHVFDLLISAFFHSHGHHDFIRRHLQASFFLESINQATRASIMVAVLSRLIQLSENLLRQHLTQLHPPLIKTVYVPDGALGKSEMLVVHDEST